MSAAIDTTPRVWIACLTCYADGRLVGEWFPAIDAESIGLDEIHAAYGGTRFGCEEAWVFDTDNLPLAREMSVTEASEWGRLLAEVEESQRDPFVAWVRSGLLDLLPGEAREQLSSFEDAYCGEWDSFRDYAEQLADDIGLLADVDDTIAAYFDWDAWTRDLAYDYTTAPAPGGVYVFRSL